MALSINSFKGMSPITEPSKLAMEFAVKAVNCRFDSGSVEPYLGLTNVSANLISNPATLFLYDDTHWFSWSVDADVVDSPINDDAYQRVYYTGESYPKMTANDVATSSGRMPSVSYKMGVKQPVAPTINGYIANEQNEEGQDDDITRFYLQTYVNGYGEEGPPSLLSGEATITNPGATVNLGLSAVGINNQNITKRRIYRTVDEAYQLVVELPITTLTYADSLPDSAMGIVLNTFSFFEPIEGMIGLTAMPNGILAGFTEFTLCFSEPYLPHAWPVEYQQTTEHEIVAIASAGNSLIVGTTGNPYIFSGVSSDAISGQKLELAQSCVSKRSMVDMGEYVIYASPDGLVAISSSSAQVITSNLFNKSKWQEYEPETIRAEYYEGKYFAFYGSDRGFVFDPKSQDFTELDFTAAGLYTDLKRDLMYILQNGSIKEFDTTGGALSFLWEKTIRLNYNPAPAAVYIDADPVSEIAFKYKVDGIELLNYSDVSSASVNQVVSTEAVFRLPATRGKEVTFTISGTGKVHKLVLAQSMGQAING
jgi:hypothetical protein